MKWLLSLAVVLGLAGLGLAFYAETIPVYTDAEAPARISEKVIELGGKERWLEWKKQIKAYETPHKPLSDLGRGLWGAGLGLSIAVASAHFYLRYPRVRKIAVVFSLWIALWLIRIPCVFWYHTLRLNRGDYPTWSDSVAIPVFIELQGLLILGIASTLVLALMLIRHPLPDRFARAAPLTLWGRIRTVFLGLWLILDVLYFIVAIPSGSEGSVITGPPSALLLLLFLSAKETRPSRKGVSFHPPGSALSDAGGITAHSRSVEETQ